MQVALCFLTEGLAPKESRLVSPKHLQRTAWRWQGHGSGPIARTAGPFYGRAQTSTILATLTSKRGMATLAARLEELPLPSRALAARAAQPQVKANGVHEETETCPILLPGK